MPAAAIASCTSAGRGNGLSGDSDTVRFLSGWQGRARVYGAVDYGGRGDFAPNPRGRTGRPGAGDGGRSGHRAGEPGRHSLVRLVLAHGEPVCDFVAPDGDGIELF